MVGYEPVPGALWSEGAAVKRSPIRPVSKKRAALNRVRTAIRKRYIGSPCEARLEGCYGQGTDLHEVLSRAQGGSLIDETGMRWLCRSCHDYITTHPAWSYEHGWLKHAEVGR